MPEEDVAEAPPALARVDSAGPSWLEASLMEQPGPGQAVRRERTTASVSNDLNEKVETSAR